MPATMNIAEYAIIFNDKNQVLMLEFKFNKSLHFPGGRLDAGEKELEALRRELMEETGLKLRTAVPFVTKVFNPKDYGHGQDCIRYAVYYLCTTMPGEVKMGIDEFNTHKWISKEDLKTAKFWLPFYKELLENAFLQHEIFLQ